jgi:hypothetical protein
VSHWLYGKTFFTVPAAFSFCDTLIRTLSVLLKFGFFFYSGCVIFFSTSSSLPYGGPRTTRTSSQPIHYIFFAIVTPTTEGRSIFGVEAERFLTNFRPSTATSESFSSTIPPNLLLC